jgi:hypothetical protein
MTGASVLLVEVATVQRFLAALDQDGRGSSVCVVCVAMAYYHV